MATKVPLKMPRVAVVGCGNWGRNHVRTMHELSALDAICDLNTAAVDALSKTIGVPGRTWSEVLRDENVQGVVLATSAGQHFAMAREALAAGKHVLVEKPLAMVPSEAEILCHLAAESSRVLMVGHLLRYHPAFLKLAEIVRKGELGRLRYIYSTRLNFGKVRQEESILWSFAPHDVSMILALVGEAPQAVHAIGSSYLHKVIADITTTHLSFSNGVNAHLFLSWLHPFKEQKLVVVGDAGMAVFDDGEPWAKKLVRYPHEIKWFEGRPEPKKAEAEPVALDPGEPLLLEGQHFLSCIAEGRPPLTGGEEGLVVLQVLAAAQHSMDHKKTIYFGSGSGSVDRSNGTHIHQTAVIDDRVTIGQGTRIWHFSHILSGVNIGPNCVIGQNVMIGPDVRVGANCKIQNNVSIYKGVTLEEEVFCGPSCVFTNVNTPRAGIDRKDEFLPTLVKKGVTIGANATIICGSTLEEYCMVAAGAVVTADVASYALVAGVPARRIGWVSRTGDLLGQDLVCPRSGERYRLSEEDRLEPIR